jgi:hypothetical protein
MASQVGQYLYAVIDCPHDQALSLVGIDGAEVRALSDGWIAAVVSAVPNRSLRPERRRLAAHHGVLKWLRERYTVLPMSFGLIAEDPDAVHRILASNREALLDQIRRVAGKVEMGLRVLWDVPNIFEYFLEQDAELRASRDRLFRGGRQPSQQELIDLGRAFDRLLGEARSTHTQTVMHVLRSRCSEIKENKPRDEREVMNLACLIDASGQKPFEAGVIEAASRFDNHFSFDFNGPWPPHNFVEVSLEL